MVRVDDSDRLTQLAHALARADSWLPLASRVCRACVHVLGAHGGALTFAPADRHEPLADKRPYVSLV